MGVGAGGMGEGAQSPPSGLAEDTWTCPLGPRAQVSRGLGRAGNIGNLRGRAEARSQGSGVGGTLQCCWGLTASALAQLLLGGTDVRLGGLGE